MRTWLFALSLIFVQLVRGQDPFPGSSPPTLTFEESYVEVPMREPGTSIEDDSWIIGAKRSLNIKGTAPLTGFDISTLDADSPLVITLGNFDSSQLEIPLGVLGDDETWEPGGTDRSVQMKIFGYNYEGEETDIGTISVTWDASSVSFTVNITTADSPLAPLTEWGFAQGAVAEDYLQTDENPINSDSVSGSFAFGPFAYDSRIVYTKGSASTATDEVHDLGDLSTVNVFGAIDGIAPTVTVTAPPVGKSTINAADGVSDDLLYTIRGTAADTRKVGTETLPGTVVLVEVRLGVPGEEGEFVEADLEENGNWSLPDAQLAVQNRLTVRVTDEAGNVFTTGVRQFSVSANGSLTIRADASEGYPDGQTGVGGTVSGTILSGGLTALINEPADEFVKTSQASGQMITLTAVPGAGSVFDGWVGTVNGEDVLQVFTETITFETTPALELTAKFVPNAFATALGKYQGLVTGDTPGERGLFKISISKKGTFTGRIQVGAVVLPIKGKLLGSGMWQGTVKKGATTYTVTFSLNLNAEEDRQLTGTVQGGEVDAEITADLKDWRKPKGSDPGKLATPATYNVLLPAAEANEDPSFPIGIGYGRVTVSKLGGVRFVGRLGDGTPVHATSTLIERKNGDLLFPLFIALDKKLGNISGMVTVLDEADNDLSGLLDWQEPATVGVEPQAFAGQIDLRGSAYVRPLPGQLIMLNTTAGQGVLSLEAPIYSKPLNPPPSSFGPFTALSATLATNHQLSAQVGPVLASLKFNPKTGLFSGSFKDPAMNNRTIKLSGAVITEANDGEGQAGGVFVRGDRAGSVTFGPPSPP